MKKALVLSLISALLLSACSDDNSSQSDAGGLAVNEQTVVAQPATIDVETVEFKEDDFDLKTTADTKIALSDNNTKIEGSGAEAEGNNIKITKSGVYEISGTLSDGVIEISATSDDKVYLILNNAQITSLSSSPLIVTEADKVTLTLKDGTENTFTDSTATELNEESEPDACIFSKEDFVINGSGTLFVNANFNDGITSKDDLRIISGNIVINSVGDGIKGKNCVAINSGDIFITSGNDGIKSTNTEEAGYVYVKNGNIEINALSDGIQAQSYIYVENGTFDIITNGGADNAPEQTSHGFGGGWDMNNTNTDDDQSRKALKAQTGIYIQNGTFSLDSYDDAIHSDGDIIINGSVITAKSGDDGVHAETSFEITSGVLTIEKSYEGIEGAVITLSGGVVDITSSDDGLNATNGSGEGFGFGAQSGDTADQAIYFNGTNLTMNAGGDGIDSNGIVKMTAGNVIVYGPTNSGNGALDYAMSFEITGGTLIALGAQGMSMTPSGGTQPFINAMGSFTANEKLVIEDESGNVLISVAPEKTFQSVVFSCPQMTENKNYKVTQGDTTATATATTQAMGGFGGTMPGGNFGGGGGRGPHPDDFEIPEGYVPQKPDKPLFQ